MAQFDENELEKLSLMSDTEIQQRESNKAKLQKKKFKDFWMAIVSILVALIILAGASASITFLLFKINTVEIEGNSKYSYDEIYTSSGLDNVSNIVQIKKESIKNKIISDYAYIKNVEVTVTLPGKVHLEITEDKAKWYGKIWDQWFVLSEDLRVIDKISTPDDRFFYGDNLKWIKLPEVDYAVVGETVIFNKTTAYAYTTSFLNELSEQSLFESLEFIDVSDRYHIALYQNQHRIKMEIGSSDSLQAKITLINKIMSDSDDISSTTIVSFNAEYVNPVIMLKGSEIFQYDE